MITNQEKWNFIVKEYHDLFHAKEDVIDNRWREYCNTLLGYQPLFGEISTQPSIHVGVHDHAIPDIVLCLNGQEVFDIELKRYSFSFSDKFEEQLISYLKLQTLSVGMIVCKEIHLYSYEILTKEIKKVCIAMKPDNPKGVRLIELLQKESFSVDDIRRFVEETADDSTAEETTTQSRITKKARNTSSAKDPDPVYLNVTTVIRNWCREMNEQGKIIFQPEMSKIAYTRFTTERMDQIITPQSKDIMGAYDSHFYAYEIRNTQANGTVKFMMAFGSKNAPIQTKEQFERVFECRNSYPKDGWEWRIVYHSETVHYYSTTTEEELIAILNSLFGQIMQEEAKLIELYQKRFGNT